MANEGALLVRDGVFAVSKSGGGTEDPGTDLGVSGVKAFNFSNTATGIVPSGITVAITGEADPTKNAGREAGYYFYVRTSGGKRGFVVYGHFGNDKTATNYHGGEYDTLGLTLGNADLSGIEVIIGKTSTGSRQRLRIDSIAVSYT
jgi:hypothetical protein